MPDYYVATTGNDSTGDGGTGTPWLTIGHAIGECALDAENTIHVDAGTYPEVVGAADYLNITQAFTGSCTIQPWHDGDAVIITDNESGTYCVRLNGCTNVEFNSVTIQPAAQNSKATVLFDDKAASGITFTDCTIKAIHTSTNTQIVRCSTITDTITGIVLDGCTLVQSGAGANTLIGVSVKVGDGGTVGITLNDCTVTGYGSVITAEFVQLHANATLTVTIDGGTYTATAGTYACTVTGGTVAISDATFTNTTRPALVLGRDNTALYDVAGAVTGCTISSTSSHAFMIGGGCDGVTASGCTITGGDYGALFKEAVDCTLSNSTITAGTTGSVYFKAATGCTVDSCTITNAVGGACVRLAVNPDSTTKSGTCTVTNSTITVSGASTLFDWGDADDDDGGGVVDGNTYTANWTNWGTVYGHNAAGLVDLQALWLAYYDVTDNDASSTETVTQRRRVGISSADRTIATMAADRTVTIL